MTSPIDSPDWTAHTLSEGRARSSHRQFDPGSFSVVRRDGPGAPPQEVGFLHVEPAGGADTVEHWVLVADYRGPVGSQQLEVKPIASFGSLSAFFAAMRMRQPAGAPYRYIRAECAHYATLPA